MREFPAGTRSGDGVAVVGVGGWVFLCEDTNEAIRQLTGELVLSPDALAEWEGVLNHHREQARRLGVPIVGLVVPDKLCLHGGEHLPPVQVSPARPIAQLLARCRDDLVYPLEALAVAGADRQVYRRVDTHVSPRGAEVLLRSVLEAFGLEVPEDAVDLESRACEVTGDLGARFSTPLVELLDVPTEPVAMEVLADNTAAIHALGGHFGIHRVVRNPAAAYQLKLAVFGASHAFPSPDDGGGLGAGLSRCFEEVHFVWAPFSFDARYVVQAEIDLVLLQTTERYLLRPPIMSVDVAGPH